MNKNLVGADYAEWFQWNDGNPDNEDRTGYFVTLDKERIKIASSDDFILGAISAISNISGIFVENNKFQQYLVDEFGRDRKEMREITYTAQEWDEEKQEVISIEKTEMIEVTLQNPDYVPGASRSDELDWVIVGLLGQLRVKDDGTCQPNGYCTVNNQGIATATEDSNHGYKVMSRVSDNVIRILFR